MDTEFHPERRDTPMLYVVTLKPEGSRPFLIDGTCEDTLRSLAPHMAGKTWVVHGGRHDLQLLQPYFGAPSALLDTQIAAGLCTPVYPAPFDHLLRTILHVEPAPSETMSDWSARPLSASQRRYAAGDVDRLLELADALLVKVSLHDRSANLNEATANFLSSLKDDRTPWRSIRGATDLDPASTAILQELVVLRDELAARTTSAPRAILGDGHLLDLAKRQPLTASSVGANRRFPRKFARFHGPAIAEIVQRVARRPAHLLPTTYPKGSKDEALRATWWAEALWSGLNDQWAPRLLVPPEMLDDLTAGRDPQGWAASILGPWARDARSRIYTAHRMDHPSVSN